MAGTGHKDCDGPTERGVCLWHLIGPYIAHCQKDAERWPCEVVRLREQLKKATSDTAAPATEG